MGKTPFSRLSPFDLQAPVSAATTWVGAKATLLGGYPLTIVNAAGGTDLTNSDCTVISDGVTPILLLASVGLNNTGAAIGQVVLNVMESALFVAGSAPQDVAITSGRSTIDFAIWVTLTKGTHNLKLNARKINANGAVTATATAGDAANDTYLQAMYLSSTGGNAASWTPVTGGAGLIWQGADNSPHILPGTEVLDVMYSRAVGGKIIGQTYDRNMLRGTIPAAVPWVSGWLNGSIFLCEEDATLAKVWTWLAAAGNFTGATNLVVKVGMYGPITAANAAAVPLLAGGVNDNTPLTSAGYAKGSGWSLAASLLRGKLYCLILHASWTVAPTTVPQFYIMNNSGALSGNNDPAQGAVNLGTISQTVFLTGLVDLPATIDLSGTRTVGSANRLPLLIAATA